MLTAEDAEDAEDAEESAVLSPLRPPWLINVGTGSRCYRARSLICLIRLPQPADEPDGRQCDHERPSVIGHSFCFGSVTNAMSCDWQ